MRELLSTNIIALREVSERYNILKCIHFTDVFINIKELVLPKADCGVTSHLVVLLNIP